MKKLLWKSSAYGVVGFVILPFERRDFVKQSFPYISNPYPSVIAKKLQKLRPKVQVVICSGNTLKWYREQ
jgi:hypothetical protein